MTVKKTKAKRLNSRLRFVEPKKIVKRKAFKKKTKIPKGYDSGLEWELHKVELKDWDHHPDKLPYVSTHTYEPDFKKVIDGKTLYVEAKGRFRDNAEAAKYSFVRECLAPDAELIFIFQDASKPMPFAKKRKDGTKYSHGEWAEKNNFRYYCAKQGLPKEIV